MEENLKTLPETERGKTVSRVILYTVITFILSYAYGFGLLPFLNRRAQDSEMMLILFQTAYSAIMFFPALGALLTRLITREGFRTHYLRPNLRGNIGTYLLAWFAPFFCTIIGAVVWFLIQPGSFDPAYTECRRRRGQGLRDARSAGSIWGLRFRQVRLLGGKNTFPRGLCRDGQSQAGAGELADQPEPPDNDWRAVRVSSNP